MHNNKLTDCRLLSLDGVRPFIISYFKFSIEIVYVQVCLRSRLQFVSTFLQEILSLDQNLSLVNYDLRKDFRLSTFNSICSQCGDKIINLEL